MDSKFILLLALIALVLLEESGVEAGKKSKKKSKHDDYDDYGDDANGDLPTQNARCGATYDLEGGGPVKINGGAENGCSLIFVGSSVCAPELKCKKFQLNGVDGECDNSYLEISDGWGGNLKVCGKAKHLVKKTVRASKGARDLFLTLKGHPGGKVQCEVYCADPKSKHPTDLLIKNKKKKKTDQRCVCGLQNKDDRIVGGEDATKYEFPWQAAVVGKGTRSPSCGAALINDRFILTATHCFWFSNTTAGQIEVLLHAHLLDFTLNGVWNRDAALGQQGSIKGSGWDKEKTTDEEERTIRLTIAEIIMHPLFTDKYDYDVALLRLAKPLDLGTIEATPICLPLQGDKRDFIGKLPKVVGWGMPDEKAGGTTRLLQKLDVPVLANDECSRMMEFDLPERMLCAGYPGGIKDACTGDSGGPLKLKTKKQFTQIGVVSWGEGCARANRPGIYARVTDMADWIQYHTRRFNAIWCRDGVSD